jgi:hypothetical protein
MNTVKRYDKADKPGKLRRAAQYRPALVDPYRDYLCKRRSEEPGVPVQQLLREIRGLGYPGSSNLLVRYLNQARADAPRLSPCRAARLLLSNPESLNYAQRETAARIGLVLPRNESPGQPDQLLRRHARPRPRQRGQGPAVGRRRTRR